MDLGKDRLYHVPFAKRQQVYQSYQDHGVHWYIRPVLKHLYETQFLNLDTLTYEMDYNFFGNLQSVQADIIPVIRSTCSDSTSSCYRSHILSGAVNVLQALEPYNFATILTRVSCENEIFNEHGPPNPSAGREAAKAHIISQVKDLSTIEQKLCVARDNSRIDDVIFCVDEICQQALAAYSRLNEEYLRKLKWGTTAKRLGSTIEEMSEICTEIVSALSRTQAIAQEVMQKAMSMSFTADDSWNTSCLNELQRLASELLNSKWMMLQGMMVVSKHGPPIIKKETKIQTSVKFLATNQLVGTGEAMEVEVVPLTETQASFLFVNGDPFNALVFDASKQSLKENVMCMQADECTFSSFEILRMNRDKEYRKRLSKSDRTLEEKCCFLYRSVLRIHNCTFIFWCCSRPFVYVTHTCQEQKAWATMVWDKAFATEDRRPFEVPSEGSPDLLIEALNSFFKRETGSSWNFTPENKQYLKFKLKEKLYPDTYTMVNEDDMKVKFHDFVHLSSGTFGNKPLSFWDWFYSIQELTTKYLKKYWNDGYIVGFIPNPQRIPRSSPLYHQHVGTAMIRFVDSIEGAVSISFVTSESDSHGNKVIQIRSKQPVTATQLALRGIAVRLTDMVDDKEADRFYHYKIGPSNETVPVVSGIVAAFGVDSRSETQAAQRLHIPPWYDKK